MTRVGIAIGILVSFICLTTLLASAQTEQRFTFNAGGGFTPLVGDIGNRLHTGWHITGGAGIVVRGPFSLGGQFTYNGFGVNRGLLDLAAAPGGDAHVWSITAEPRLQLPFAAKVKPYVVGGVGYYRRVVHFTAPGLQQVTFFDPFLGFLFPGVVPANQVLATITRNGIGGNVGGGLAINLGSSGAQFFTEVRYHYAATGSIPTRMIPVTFGIRF